jgi:hypothetical protein
MELELMTRRQNVKGSRLKITCGDTLGPRFYADENFPTAAIEILRRLGANVITVRDARRRGHPDENHTAEALRMGRILITCDRDYLNERRFPLIHCPL